MSEKTQLPAETRTSRIKMRGNIRMFRFRVTGLPGHENVGGLAIRRLVPRLTHRLRKRSHWGSCLRFHS